MYLCRIICGFCEVFCFIYFPIWVDQYGVKGSKVIWITFLQLGVPVGTILGYLNADGLANSLVIAGAEDNKHRASPVLA